MLAKLGLARLLLGLQLLELGLAALLLGCELVDLGAAACELVQELVVDLVAVLGLRALRRLLGRPSRRAGLGGGLPLELRAEPRAESLLGLLGWILFA